MHHIFPLPKKSEYNACLKYVQSLNRANTDTFDFEKFSPNMYIQNRLDISLVFPINNKMEKRII